MTEKDTGGVMIGKQSMKMGVDMLTVNPHDIPSIQKVGTILVRTRIQAKTTVVTPEMTGMVTWAALITPL